MMSFARRYCSTAWSIKFFNMMYLFNKWLVFSMLSQEYFASSELSLKRIFTPMLKLEE